MQLDSPSSSGLRLRVSRGGSRHTSSFSQPSPSRIILTGGQSLEDPLLNQPIPELPAVEPPSCTVTSGSASKKFSSSSTVDYATRLHPTLLRHYYDMMATSSLNIEGSTTPLPALAFQEVVLGDIIGRGGFSFVHEIKYVKLQEIYDTGNEEAVSRAEFASTFDTSGDNGTSNNISNKPPAQQFVLKTLRPDLPEDEHNKGIIDLAVEAQFLAALSHPHILSLRGHANSDPLESRYFVILDRLVSTLDHKLKVWRKDVGINMGYWFGPCFGYCCGRPHVIHRIWMERFTVARDIASALEYLHAQDIVYRDLKPDNIGFNSDGQLKMFDFGLAKRITNADKSDDELYKLTGNTGSLRYMAPEVAMNKPYSLSVDAYSFGVLFWQLCALTVPYSGYSCKMHSDLVVGKGYRPSPDASWPENWSLLMSQCWAVDHRSRPSFKHILKVMNAELEDWTTEGEDFMTNEDGKETEKIKARKGKSVFKIKARKDRQTLDLDTRLAKPEGGTERKHDANIV
mmetsp:Transcript_25427/g.54695  ORF Transcript_25427/g.54695 Transcript_25427/m.54695 type:complete len:513 (+) Transcript_25427:43-1581(+)